MGRTRKQAAEKSSAVQAALSPTASPSRDKKRLTDQQRKAVDQRDVSIVLSSGAGCGKTSVLTERYLSLLTKDKVPVSQIVAITFTDKAAREMRGRIRGVIQEKMNQATGDEVAACAKHLCDLETAPISTIHSFCGNLLRQNAIEAGLDARFEVLESVLSVNIEADAVNDCLQRLLLSETATGEDLRQLVFIYGWQPVVTGVRSLVQQRDPEAWAGWLAKSAEQVAGDWQEFAAALLPRSVQHFLDCRPRLTGLAETLNPGLCLPEKMRDNVILVREKLPTLHLQTDIAAAVEEILQAARVQSVHKSKWPDQKAHALLKDEFEYVRDQLKALPLDIVACDDEELCAAATVGQRFLRVASEAVAEYAERKRRDAVVDFDDMLLIARDLLRTSKTVRERLHKRYRFILLDELQDTDPVQMEIVRLLCGEGLRQGKLFAVGDAKQSIYRFRGADVELFRQLRTEVGADGQMSLDRNFRSQPAVLDFANTLFADCLPDFEPLHADRPQLAQRPCVEFLWTRCEQENAEEARQFEAETIACRIDAMLNTEKLVVESPEGGVASVRPVQRKDIAILFRSMSNVHLYEQALRDHDLDYYLVGGRAFFAQQEIYDLINLLKAMENPLDGISLAGTLRSPFCCLSDEALYVLGRPRGELWTGLLDPSRQAQLPANQKQRVQRARANLQRWRGLKDRLPIAELLNKVLEDSGYDAALCLESLGQRKLANLWKLIDLARTFDGSSLLGTPEFIARLGSLMRDQPREEEAATNPEGNDVIRLMTIHKAKGLEFPVVIVPDLAAEMASNRLPVVRWDARLGCVARPPADDDPPPFSAAGWRLLAEDDKLADWEESLRTFYVACTRARDYLVLSASRCQDEGTKSAWMQTLMRHFDLTTGACNDPAVEASGRLARVAETPSSVKKKRSPGTLLESSVAVCSNSWQPITPPSTAAEQFAAEDGSDQNDWPPTSI